MQLHNELLWLAKQIDKIPVSNEPSLWKAMREIGNTSAVNGSVATKRHVYITGEPQVVYTLTDLFQSVELLKDVVTLTSAKYPHPVLQWMDITYYPPNTLQMLPKNKMLTLFTEHRLPLWSRSLFIEQKICNVVATENILALLHMPNINQFLVDDFSYHYLLDDVVVTRNMTIAQSKQQLTPELPKQYILQLMTMKDSNEEKEKNLILDKIAVHMLNTFWLQNHPSFPQWMPVLLREITAFLKIKHNNATIEEIIKELKVWGNRDKRIS
ncbi:hypothetical protein C3943_21590 [Lysinibacillus sp. B2A1]|nr:hypothetical protein C3943_21590 [Lysinibacillus sp. B2A1]